MYNSEVSAAFRETNYEPELYWMIPLDLGIFDASLLSVGFVHQSNGRNIPLSRSWNRIYLNFIWEKNNWAFSAKPWWRIPEDDKDDPLDTDGNDNPDIDDFMGYFPLRIPKVYNLRRDPFERADTDSNSYNSWWDKNVGSMGMLGMGAVSELVGSLQQFPPKQRPGTFTVDQIMEVVFKKK